MKRSKPRVLRRLVWVVPGAFLVACAVVSRFPGTVERHYASDIAPAIQHLLGAVTNGFTFAVGEALVLAIVGFLLIGCSHAALRWRAGDLNLKMSLMPLVRAIATTVLWLVALFYLVWGLHYYRTPAHERLGWSEVQTESWEAEPEELIALTLLLTEATNAAYFEIHGREDAGEPTTAADMHNVHLAIEEGFASAHRALSLSGPLAEPHGPAKPLLSSPLFSRFGIAGIYFPFSGEANVNRDIPGWSLPHVVAHEKAHQRGIATEDEANFYGFLACIYAPLPEAKYSGLLFAQRQVLRALLNVAPEKGMAVVKQRHPGVQRDINAYRAFWLGQRGPLTDVGSAFNDTYLKLNGVKRGSASYRESLLLIAALFRDPKALASLPDYLSSAKRTGHPTRSPTSTGSSSSS